MLALILILLLASHLLCMNISSAGPLLCIWLVTKNQTGEANESQAMAMHLAMWSITLLIVGVLIGLVMGFVQLAGGDGELIAVLPLFQKKIGWGVLELLCSFGWMLAYWAWLKWKPPQRFVPRFLHGSLAFLAATNLLYHFPPLLTIMTMSAGGEIELTGEVDAATFRQLFSTPNVLAHTLHFCLASIAVSGVFVFWLARRLADPKPYHVIGARVALFASALQLPSGLWLLFVTPPEPQSRLVGGDGLVSSLFVAALFCAFYLLQNLAVLAFGEVNEKAPRRCGALLIATVLLMTGVLYFLRA